MPILINAFDRFDLNQILICPVCNEVLEEPTTLSCGYTICLRCLSTSNSIISAPVKTEVFRCPVSRCKAPTHIFAPQLSSDFVITEIVSIFRHYFLDTHLLPLSPPITYTCPDDNDAMYKMSMCINAIATLTRCHGCAFSIPNNNVDMITMPCGHTYCRLCILKAKIESNSCPTCSNPLPKYKTLSEQPPNQLITTFLEYFRQKEQTSRLLIDVDQTTTSPSMTFFNNTLPSEDYQHVPLFISGKVILPGQRLRLPIFSSKHLHMFRNALIPSFTSHRQDSICLAAVHRIHPQLAQFGTILKITSVEHRADTIIIDVIGLDRFKLETHYENENGTIIGDFSLLKEVALGHRDGTFISEEGQEKLGYMASYATDLADIILQFVHRLGSPTNSAAVMTTNTVFMHTQTDGLLGPLWLESVKSLHGPEPSRDDPAAVCWWAAAILPLPSKDLYGLLRTQSIIDRLEFVISWMHDLQSQWKRCRSAAIHAFSKVPLQQ
ncbi:MAG: PUA-like domain-containing protein [Benjaminiella poitrasii]|nr:MAG: PUA-like domain-containing protein [Benjaminiella poitrasii]